MRIENWELRIETWESAWIVIVLNKKTKRTLNAYRDFKNSIDTAKVEKTIEIAKELKTLGIPFDQISLATKLSIEEIEKL